MWYGRRTILVLTGCLFILFTLVPITWSDQSSRDITASSKISPNTISITGNYWALIIGIDKYQSAPKLETAVRDAVGVRDVLIERYGFEPLRIIELLDHDATRTNIEDALYQLGRQAGVEDHVLIYYAGHGQYDEDGNLGWWVPVDGNPKRPGTFVTNASIRDYIKGMKARHVYLVADSCFSGTLFGTRALPPIDDKFYAKLSTKRSRWGLTSGGTEPVADRGQDGHSAFAYHFIKLLKDNTSPYLIPSHIFDQLAPIIANNSDQTPRSEPIKGAGDEGGQFVLRLVSEATGSDAPSKLLPPSAAISSDELARLKGELNRLKAQEMSPRPAPPQTTSKPGSLWVTAEGAAVVRAGTSLGELRARSRDEARRKVVEQAVLAFVEDPRDARRDRLGDNLAQSVARGSVAEEEIIEEGLRQAGTDGTRVVFVTQLRALVVREKTGRRKDFQIMATLNKRSFRQGDEMIITATPTKDAYIHIFSIAPDDEVTALLPNRFTQHNFVESQKRLVFPDEAERKAGIRLRTFAPQELRQGTERVQVIATTRNVDLIKGRIREGMYQVYAGKDSAFASDLLRELSLLDQSEWAEATVAYEITR